MNNNRRVTVTPNQSFSVIFFQYCKIKFLHSASYSNFYLHYVGHLHKIYSKVTNAESVLNFILEPYLNHYLGHLHKIFYIKKSFQLKNIKRGFTHRLWSSTIDSHSFKCVRHMQKNLMGLFVNCDYDAGKYEGL